MTTTARTALRQSTIKKLYAGQDIVVSTVGPLKIDSDTDVNETFAAADTTLTVDDGTKFASGDYIMIDDEVLYISAVATNDLTVARAQSGTTDADHADNSDVFLYLDFTTEIGLTALSDPVLAPAAQSGDFVDAWIYVSTQPAAVASGALLDEDLTAAETAIDVDVSGTDDAAPFVPGDGIQVDDEIMRVTAVNLTDEDITVVRGIQSTTAAVHSDNAIVYKIGPAVGEVVRVFNAGFSNKSSLLYVSPSLSCRMVDGQEYEVHYKFHPTKVHNWIDEILTNIRHPIYLPLSLITDGDMEAGNTTSWTESATTGTAPTLTKDTTIVLHGRQSLKILANADATNSYALSSSIYLPPNTQVIVAADVYITSGDSAKITLYDVTNAEELETAESGATGWVHLEFTHTTPSDCETVSVWLESPAASDTTYWNNVSLLPTQRAVYDYPDTLEWSEDLEGAFYFPKGTGLSATTDDNAYALFEHATQKWSEVTSLRDETAVTPFRLQLHKQPVDEQIFVRGLIDYSALATDSATTRAPSDIVVDLALVLALEDWALDDIEKERHEAATAKQTRAERIGVLLSPRMKQFRPQSGKVHGTRG